MSTSPPKASNKASNNVHTLHQCVVNTFDTNREYLKHCCNNDSKQPYVSEYIKKRCDELHTVDVDDTRRLQNLEKIQNALRSFD